MTRLRMTIGQLEFVAVMEEEQAPETCAAFKAILPYRQKLIHVRWSGEAGWIPLGDYELGVGFENATSYPAPGQVIFYPGGYSETELLVAYGAVCFASKMGQLAGNHFLTVVEGQEQLAGLGRLLLYEGAQDIVFEQID
jgi:hypothetical protein